MYFSNYRKLQINIWKPAPDIDQNFCTFIGDESKSRVKIVMREIRGMGRKEDRQDSYSVQEVQKFVR